MLQPRRPGPSRGVFLSCALAPAISLGVFRCLLRSSFVPFSVRMPAWSASKIFRTLFASSAMPVSWLSRFTRSSGLHPARPTGAGTSWSACRSMTMARRLLGRSRRRASVRSRTVAFFAYATHAANASRRAGCLTRTYASPAPPACSGSCIDTGKRTSHDWLPGFVGAGSFQRHRWGQHRMHRVCSVADGALTRFGRAAAI